MAVILVDEAVAVDVVVHGRADRRHAGYGGGVRGRGVDDEHASRCHLGRSPGRRLDWVVVGAEVVVRQCRLEIVQVGAEPSSLQGGDDLAEERLAEGAGAQAEDRRERVQRLSRR